MPGAASLTGVLYLDATAPKDGTAIDIFNFGLIGGSRMGLSAVKIDFRKFNWIGSISQDITACYVWHTLGIKTLADAKAHGTLHFGLSSFGASNDINEKILMNIFGVHIQQVPGYSGSAEELLAIERGELDGTCGTWSSVPRIGLPSRKSCRSTARRRSSRPACRRAFPMWSILRRPRAIARSSVSSSHRASWDGLSSRPPPSPPIA